MRYEGRIHEDVTRSLQRTSERRGGGIAISAGLWIEHLGYDEQVRDQVAKRSRNLDLLGRMAAKDPNDAYVQYQISLEASKRNLNTIIDQILAANPDAEIILMTMNSALDVPAKGVRGATNRPQIAAYYQGYCDVAHKRHLPLRRGRKGHVAGLKFR